MKNKTGSKPNYRALERKILIRIIVLTVAAILIVYVFQALARGSFGNFIAKVMESLFGLSRDQAVWLYHVLIRNNLDLLMVLAVATFMIILSHFLLTQFSRYFKEISKGLDTLVAEEENTIKLSPEIAPMEKKLISIKSALSEKDREARLAEQRKNDMVMYLAHDIKTPLTSVIGYLSLLQESGDLPKKQREKYIGITLNKANRLEKLVDEFFEIARFNFQTTVLQKEVIDLYYMLQQMTDEFFPSLSKNKQTITLQIPENMKIYGDAEKLARVFNNIIKNAIAYSPKNAEISITAECTVKGSIIKFSNFGVIAQEKLAAIFEKFYRLDSARSTQSGGAGLGLAIAKEIVNNHHGSIWAGCDGERTTFTVELPLPASLET